MWNLKHFGLQQSLEQNLKISLSMHVHEDTAVFHFTLLTHMHYMYEFMHA